MMKEYWCNDTGRGKPNTRRNLSHAILFATNPTRRSLESNNVTLSYFNFVKTISTMVA